MGKWGEGVCEKASEKKQKRDFCGAEHCHPRKLPGRPATRQAVLLGVTGEVVKARMANGE